MQRPRDRGLGRGAPRALVSPAVVPPLFRSRPLLVVAAVGVAALLALGFLPLFGGPGYEIALAAGVLLPSLVALAVALEVGRHRPSPFEAVRRGVAAGAVVAVLAWSTTLVHGLRAGFCDPVGGSVTFALGPGLGCLMAGLWGAFAGEVASLVRGGKKRALLATVLALAGPIGGIALSVWRFYASPIVFAYDPFVGFFSGTLYDTVVDAGVPLLTYRAGSVLTLVAASILAAHLVFPDSGGLHLRPIGRPGLALLGAACATASFVLVLEGWRLGHWQTSATIATELGARTSGARCDVVYPRSMRESEARLFARDCDEEVAAAERYFEVSGTPRITAYLFRDAAQKRRLMGAEHTYIAKPWRREVYVQQGGYPHPVLGHEIAHVVAGTFARGPFRVAGAWSGIRANPGLIEGAAVAASPDDDELTPAEWSRSMLDLGILPPLDRVFALGFLGENSSKSYTVAGAFVGWVRDRFGAAALRRWYGGEPLATVAGEPFAKLEAEFRDALAKLEVPATARAIAKARFDRPSVFGRRCPHEVDALRLAGGEAESRGDWLGATTDYERLLLLDPHDAGAHLRLATCKLRTGDVADAKQRLERTAADATMPATVRDRALVDLADLATDEGDLDRAEKLYGEIEARTLDEDSLRTLDVKLGALRDPRARRAIVALLIGSPDRGVDGGTAAAYLGQWIGEDPTDGLPEYLLGRGLVNRRLYDQAAERFDRALAKRLPPGRVLREALRQRTIVACAMGDVPAAKRAYELWLDRAEAGGARRDAMKRMMERCVGEAVAAAR